MCREGLFDAVSKAICWFSGFGTVFEPAEITTADTYNPRSQAFLIYAFLSGTDEYMQAVSDWIKRATVYTNGLLGLLKPDGSMYHHGNHYTAYASDGLTGLMPVIYSLSGTSYEISAAAAERINKVIGNMIFYTEKRVYPISMAGRHPDGNREIDKVLFDV
ncbi:MAG: chondroitinase family polysaccharide lyase [Candidatus Ornithomonoglobus sp.]